MSSLCLIALSLGLGQNFDRPEWTLAPAFIPGVELVYRGTCTEQSLVPGVQHQKQYDIEMILLMQDKTATGGNAVLQTSISVHEPKNFSAKEAASAPGSVRLDWVQMDRRGGLRRRGDNTESLAVPLSGPPLQETGAFFEMPVVPVNRLSYWEEFEEHRPLRGWRIDTTPRFPLGVEQCIGTPCLRLQWTQESPDWKEPRADSTAWRRQETIWFAYQAGQVFRVERIIERREPGRSEPTQRIITKYEMESRFKHVGQLYEDRMEEIAKFGKYQAEAKPLLAQPALYRGNIDALLTKMNSYLNSTPPNPYRKALVHLKGKLERARTGELPINPQVVQAGNKAVQPLGIGQKVPDFLITELTSQLDRKNTKRFHDFLGQPVLVLYYNPTTATGKEVLRFAQKLAEEHLDDLQVVGMAVSDDVKLVLRQFEELDLSFPILDGKAMIHTFGVDGTPRMVLLDGDGVVRFAFTGWGYHSPREVRNEVRRLLARKR